MKILETGIGPSCETACLNIKVPYGLLIFLLFVYKRSSDRYVDMLYISITLYALGKVYTDD